ncbi:hypothetical protein NKH77_42220 [Streptomyces sp. M19]
MRNDGEHRLVAVAGFGQSTATTGLAVRELRAAQVPMMGSTVAADQLAADPPSFFRVSAPNEAQTAAAAEYLRERQKKDRATPSTSSRTSSGTTPTTSRSAGTSGGRRTGRAQARDQERAHLRVRRPSTATALAGLVDKICRPGSARRGLLRGPRP